LQPRNFHTILSEDSISYALRDKINCVTSFEDFEGLQNASEHGVGTVMVVGGGFFGTELAIILKSMGMAVKHVFEENAPLGRVLPPYLCNHITSKMEAIGVQVFPDQLVTGVQKDPDSEDEDDPTMLVSLQGEDETTPVPADYLVLASTQIDPQVKLASESGLEIDQANGGLVVNAQFEAVAGLFVAGNAASFYDPAVGRRRIDMYDHAVQSGKLAGHNMTTKSGSKRMYTHQPMFSSNLASIGVDCKAVGIVDANLQTVGVFSACRNPETNELVERTPESGFERGVVYYLNGNKVVGIFLWNASDLSDKARELICSKFQASSPMDLEKALEVSADGLHDVIVT
jgi:programmed cell death 8 (apoptosis-inducing factor)